MSKYVVFIFDICVFKTDKPIKSMPNIRQFDTYDDIFSYIEKTYLTRFSSMTQFLSIYSDSIDEICFARNVRVHIEHNFISIQYEAVDSIWIHFLEIPTVFVEFFISETGASYEANKESKMNNIERNRQIFELHECGQSYSQLGIQFGLSLSRIKQIYKKEQERVNAKKAHVDAINGETLYTFLDALKEVCETEMQVTRIFRCLERAGIINEIESHHDILDTYSDETLLSIRSFGPTSLIFARRANELYKQKRTMLGD